MSRIATASIAIGPAARSALADRLPPLEAIPSGVDELAAPAASPAGGDRVEPEHVEAQIIERDDRDRA